MWPSYATQRGCSNTGRSEGIGVLIAQCWPLESATSDRISCRLNVNWGYQHIVVFPTGGIVNWRYFQLAEKSSGLMTFLWHFYDQHVQEQQQQYCYNLHMLYSEHIHCKCHFQYVILWAHLLGGGSLVMLCYILSTFNIFLIYMLCCECEWEIMTSWQ